MTLPKELTTVTPLSKAVALLLFILLPIISFIFGMNYQAGYFDKKMVAPSPTPEPVACTMDAKICPDGTAVGRIPPNCEFEKCPTTEQTEGKKFSGTITGLQYDCHFDGICGVSIGKAFVVVDSGEGPVDQPRIRGSVPEDLMNEDKKNEFIGKQVEVYAAQDGGRTDSFTLFGSTDYYIKVIDTKMTGTFCGGIAGKMCPAGYYCKYDGTYPDAGGTCLKSGKTKTQFVCPPGDYVDCMPGPDRGKDDQCSTEYLTWAEKNCPGFQGAAY